MKIKGEKVTLIPISQEEKDKFYTLATESYGSIFWYDAQERSELTEEIFFYDWHEAYFDVNSREEGQLFWITISGEKIGAISYNRMDSKNKIVELDILIGEEKYCGKEYGPDALKTLLKYLFENFDIHKVWIGARANNPRAIRAYQKAGLKKEAVLRETDLFGGKFVDCIIFGILRREFEQK